MVYLNGVELFRSNMPEGEVQHSTPALSAVGGADESTFFEFSFPGSVLVNGSNLIAVEIHQNSGSSSDLSFDLEIEAEQLGGDQTISMEPELTLTLDGDRSLIAAFQPESARVLPSSISGSQTLTAAGSPHLALGSVTIEPNAILTLEPGTEVRFAEGADLIVRGKLEANGTAEAPVAFRGIGGGKWGAVCFDQASSGSTLSHTLIQGATTGADAARFNAAVAVQNSDLTLDRVTINHCRQPFNAVGGRITLIGCTFDGTGAGDDILHVQNASARIESCRLFGNGEVDFDSVDEGVIRNSIIEIISDDPNRDGIDIGASKNVLIEGNRIFNTPDKGISVGEKSLGTLIRRNLIVNAAMGVAVKDA
ncbi:MAG: right-handed parallel beta-helix repeat-containing protein, partial [candidate division KSB1 bacterium]|nr:right-handed parallel beta-helix repeat-containing protein [candidate division KSB1 bacterium]